MSRNDFSYITKYVEDNFHRSDLSYEQVASYAGFSKTYLSRLFRSKIGMSYIEYLTKLRMEKANELLRTTKLPVKEIHQMVGYLDQSSFRRKFKAYFGISVSNVRGTSCENADVGNDCPTDESDL